MEGNPDLKLRIMITVVAARVFYITSIWMPTSKKTTKYYASFDDVQVLGDEASIPFVEGAQLDYVEDLMGSSFQMTTTHI